MVTRAPPSSWASPMVELRPPGRRVLRKVPSSLKREMPSLWSTASPPVAREQTLVGEARLQPGRGPSCSPPALKSCTVLREGTAAASLPSLRMARPAAPSNPATVCPVSPRPVDDDESLLLILAFHPGQVNAKLPCV